MIRRLLEYDRRLRQTYRDGPAVFNHPGRRMAGYRSPTVLFFHWLRAFAMTHFTFPGRVLFLVAGGLLVAGMTALLMPIYLLSFVFTSLFFVNLTVGWLWRPQLDVRRRAGGPAAAGTPIRVDYRIRNRGRRTAWDLLVDAVPYPAEVAFLQGQHLVPALSPGQELCLKTTIAVRRRGRYLLPLPVAASSFPFGLWCWPSLGEPEQPLLIYPQYVPLRAMGLPKGFHDDTGGSAPESRSGRSIEFLGCREYRYGDNPRHLHALTSARLRQPVVKEFREEELYQTAILLDTFVPRHRPANPFRRALRHHLEETLTLTSAVAAHLIQRHYLIDFLVPGSDNFHLQRGQGRAQLQEVLGTIAGLQPQYRESFHGPSDELCFEISQIGSLVMILMSWDEPRRTFAARLRRTGVAIKTIVITPETVSLPPGEHAAIAVSPEAIRAGRVVEL